MSLISGNSFFRSCFGQGHEVKSCFTGRRSSEYCGRFLPTPNTNELAWFRNSLAPPGKPVWHIYDQNSVAWSRNKPNFMHRNNKPQIEPYLWCWRIKDCFQSILKWIKPSWWITCRFCLTKCLLDLRGALRLVISLLAKYVECRLPPRYEYSCFQ